MCEYDGKNLTQLESDDWGEAPQDLGPSAIRCYELRKKPLADFTLEDMRLLLGQDIGLDYLMPKALGQLEKDPLAKGMHYKGDLLCNALRVDPEFLSSHKDIRSRLERLVSMAYEALSGLDEIDRETTSEALQEAVEEFNRGF